MITPSTSTSSTRSDSVQVEFSRADIAVAKVMVKRLVRAGYRKGPSDYLLLSDTALEQWFDGEALAYLHENGKVRQGGVLEIG